MQWKLPDEFNRDIRVGRPYPDNRGMIVTIKLTIVNRGELWL